MRIQGKKYLWQLPEHNPDILLIAQKNNVSMPIAQTLYSRGYTTPEAVSMFLFTSFEQDVAHPSLLQDANKAVDRIIQAISNKEKILVFGDYDVDGITSSSLMMMCLLPLGAEINFFLPHRVKDGYGLSSTVVERAARNGYSLIVTVDNGITAFEPAQKARECNIDLIITDHHKQHGSLPDAYAVVNPNRLDCQYPFKALAGVGVTFKILSLLYERLGHTLPHKVYELLLLGTVADVVPLLGENRFWVRHGLHYINTTQSFSLQAMCKNGKLTKPMLSATDIGFCITPQLNALGRLDDPRDGVAFLIGTDQQRVEQVSRVLFELNEVRKEIERSIFVEIEAQIAQKKIDLDRENIILASSDQWPPGVIGLVASRLVSAYGKPAILLHVTKQGIAKGSCRSISAFNMFNALHETQDLLIQFGGHAHAAGLALHEKNIIHLKEKLEKYIATILTPDDLQPKIMLDARIQLSDLNHRFIQDLHQLEPFGNSNQQPTFYAHEVVLIQEPQLLKEKHVKCRVFADGVIKPVMFFNRPELLSVLREQGTRPFSLAAQVVENYWQGHISIELVGIDIAQPEGIL